MWAATESMAGNPAGSANVRTALSVAWIFAVTQVVVETLIVALGYHAYILMPVVSDRQMYDFCLKLWLSLPGAATWVTAGGLDTFVAVGFTPKLSRIVGLLVPSLVVASAIALAAAGVCEMRRRTISHGTVLWTLVGAGVAVHAADFIATMHVPKAWTVRIVLRNVGRIVIWDRLFVAGVALGISAAVVALLLRAGPTRSRKGVTALVATLALVVLFAQRPPAAVGGAVTAPPPVPGPAANVILISIDSLRADRLGCYGLDRPTSPAIDALAAQGARFANAMSTTSWTLPAHMSMLTGRTLLSHGVVMENDRLPDGVPTLAESLRGTGLATGGIVSMLYLGRQYGFDRGFDVYDDTTIPAKTWFESHRDEPAPAVTRFALDWLQQHREQRFFLFLHFWDVHYDYAPPPPYDTMFDPDYRGTISGENFYRNQAVNRRMPARDLQHLLAVYDGEVRWVDEHVGQILRTVDALGLADTTAIIVTADHGDEFFEHGGKGHRRTLYREVMHVPLIVRAPGVPPGRVVTAPVSLVDVMPTALELAGAAAPPGMDGESLLALTRGGAIAPRPGVYGWLCVARPGTDCLGMQHSAAGTLVHTFQPFGIEFFAPDDLAQQRNLGRGTEWPRREQLGLLRGQLAAQWAAYRRDGKRQGRVAIDKATRERLRQLGYGDD